MVSVSNTDPYCTELQAGFEYKTEVFFCKCATPTTRESGFKKTVYPKQYKSLNI